MRHKKPTVSLCVTAYRESVRGGCGWILECIEAACNSTFIDEIVVVNDGTLDFPELASALRDIPKLRFVQNPKRLHVFGNKLESVWQATTDWVLMCDSDNIMDEAYYVNLLKIRPWQDDVWYAASRANPIFDYRAFVGTWDIKSLVDSVTLDYKMFWCMVNTGNQFVHRNTFLSVFGHLRGTRFDLTQPDYFGVDDRRDEKWFLTYGANDSFFMLKEWMLSGNRICVVDGLEYGHRMGDKITSNYERGPDEKSMIPPAYFMEMRDFVDGESHTYAVDQTFSLITRMVRDGEEVIFLNHKTGLYCRG